VGSQGGNGWLSDITRELMLGKALALVAVRVKVSTGFLLCKLEEPEGQLASMSLLVIIKNGIKRIKRLRKSLNSSKAVRYV